MPRLKGQRGGGIYGPATINKREFAKGQREREALLAEKEAEKKRHVRAHNAIRLVFQWIGGVEKMAEWAAENPTDFYTKMYAKLLPTQLKADMNVNVRKTIHEIPDHELQAIVARECAGTAGEATGEDETR